MALGRTRAVGLVGVDGFAVDVEADISPGLPNTTLSGLPDESCRQAPKRVWAAAQNSGVPVPLRRVTVNLSPASLPKIGSGFDLAIAVAVLIAAESIPASVASDVVHLGELGLDGSVRGIRGVLPLVDAAARCGNRVVVVPAENAAEARLVGGVEVVPVRHLTQLLQRYAALAAGRQPDDLCAAGASPRVEQIEAAPPDLRDVVGQDEARLALEVAAAGGHHLSLLGPPGAGKTMLAQRLPGILPPLDDAQALEVAAIASIAGVLVPGADLPRRPPFVAPHHGASMPAVIGGGSHAIRPGAVTLAHHGVLFLDEAPLFSTDVLQSLRQPLEAGAVTVARMRQTARYPARFQLVLAANPCPCGQAFGKGLRCTCRAAEIMRHFNRLKGPLTDRIDLHVRVDQPTLASLAGPGGESSAAVAGRVAAARASQAERLGAFGWRLNRDVPGPALRVGPLSPAPRHRRVLDAALDRGALTLRGYDRCLRVAWTLRDLRGGGAPTADDIDEALVLRTSGRAAA